MNASAKQDAQFWLLHAERDLGFARLGLELGGVYAQTCFMVQQSAEKALKALLYLRGAKYLGENTTTELLARAADASPGLNRYQEMAGRLDRYYLTARYLNSKPGGVPYEDFTEEQAKKAIGEAENLILEVRNIIRLAR